MNKKLISSLAIVSLLVLPLAVFAVPATRTLTGIITSLQTLAWQIFGLIAVICFVIAGILFLTSGGDPEKVQTARNAFMWGVAGIVVGILAYSIISIIEYAV